MTIYMYFALLSWAVMAYGYSRRKDRSVHVPFMSLGIIMDTMLVLYLQVTRDAIGTALGFSLSILKQIHILFSASAFFLYIPVVYFGIKLVKRTATPGQRALHVKIATTALILRTLGLLFMFSMWKN
jgi:hypothetical protein